MIGLKEHSILFFRVLSTIHLTMAIKSVEVYSQALDLLGKHGRLVGLDVLAKEYEMINLKVLIFLLDAITYVMVTINCCFEFFDDMERLVFCLVTFGFGIQVRF
jgi:hypothetical protein